MSTQLCAVRLADHSLGMANLKHTKGGQTFAASYNQLIMQKVKYIKPKIANDVRKLIIWVHCKNIENPDNISFQMLITASK